MKQSKLTTALAATLASSALLLVGPGAAVAAKDKPERIEKEYKKHQPFPEVCDPVVLAETGTCLIRK